MHHFKLQITLIYLQFLILPFISVGQANKQDYLVLTSNDTLIGKVEYIKESGFGGREFHKKIRVTLEDGKTKRFSSKKVESFSTNGTLYESFWLDQQSISTLNLTSIINSKYVIDQKNGNQHFLRVISKGSLSHYEMEWFEQGNSTLWSMALLIKQNESFFIRADQGLLGLKKKILIDYFSGCSTAKEALSQKHIKEVAQVVEIYNSKCTTE